MPVRLDASAYPPMPRPADTQQQPPGPPMPFAPPANPSRPRVPPGPWNQEQPGAPAPVPMLPPQAAAPEQPGAAKLPAAVPAGAAKGVWAPPPGVSPQGGAALGDTRALMQMMQQEATRLTPQASPFEDWLRDGPEPIKIVRGVPGTQHESWTPGHGPGGMGGHWTRWTGSITNETPFGMIQGELPNPAMLQYARQEQGRQQALAAMGEASKAFAPAYQSQAAMADAQARMAAEFGPARTAREVANAAAIEARNKTGDEAEAQRVWQHTFDNWMAAMGGNAPPMLPNPNGGQPPRMPQPGAAPQPGGFADDFTDQAARDALVGAGILNDKGLAPSQSLDTLALGQLLQQNQGLGERGLPAVVRVLRRAGIPDDKIAQAVERGVIRLASEGVLGGRGSLEIPGGKPPATLPAANLGGYVISPTYGAEGTNYAFSGEAPQSLTGFTIKGPGVEHWYSTMGFPTVGPRPFDWLPTLREQTKADYRARGEALSRLLQALHAGTNAGQGGLTPAVPMTPPGTLTGTAAPPPMKGALPNQGAGQGPPMGWQGPPIPAGGGPTVAPR